MPGCSVLLQPSLTASASMADASEFGEVLLDIEQR
jgi:hypothetical protein